MSSESQITPLPSPTSSPFIDHFDHKIPILLNNRDLINVTAQTCLQEFGEHQQSFSSSRSGNEEIFVFEIWNGDFAESAMEEKGTSPTYDNTVKSHSETSSTTTPSSCSIPTLNLTLLKPPEVDEEDRSGKATANGTLEEIKRIAVTTTTTTTMQATATPMRASFKRKSLAQSTTKPLFHLISSSPRDKAPESPHSSPRAHPKETKPLDKSALSALKTSWKKTAYKPPISTKIINKEVYKICRAFVWDILRTEPTNDLLLLYSKISLKTPHIIKIIQKNGILLGNILKRAEIFYQALQNLQVERGVKSPERNYLYLQLKDIANIQDTGSCSDSLGGTGPPKESKEIAVFLNLFKKFQEIKSNQEVSLLLLHIFGDSKETIDAVLVSLSIWGKPNQKTDELLDKHIRDACQECILAAGAPFMEHIFPSPKIDRDRLGSLTIGKIIDSFRRGESILFKSIVINNQLFHGTNPSALNHSTPKSKKKSSFWTSLFKKIYKKFDPTLSTQEIKRQVTLFKKSRLENIANFTNQIPCLPILGLMTIDWWAIGNEYFFDFFSPFRQTPYGIKTKKESLECTNECVLVIQSKYSFEVIQKKCYLLCPLSDPNYATSSLNEKRPIAEIPILWTTIQEDREWREKLEISKPDFKILPGARKEEEWFVYKTLGNFTHIHVKLLGKKLQVL